MDCKHCGKSFDNQDSLNEHMTETHDETIMYNCDVCSKLFDLKGSYTDHMRSHVNDHIRYECTECPSFFKNPGHLSSHIRREHSKTIGDTFQCDHCSKQFPDKAVINSHIKMCHSSVLKAHKCHICYKIFNNKPKLKWHIYSTHSKNFSKTACPYCPSKFTWPHHLKAHIKKKHVDQGRVPMDLLKKGLFAIRRRKNNCSICLEKFTNKLELLLHLRNGHNQEIDIYKCCRCDAVFSMKNSLKIHLDKHKRTSEANKQHRCHQCYPKSSPKPYIEQSIDHNEQEADSSATSKDIIDFEVILMEYDDIQKMITQRKKQPLINTNDEDSIESVPELSVDVVECESIAEDDNINNDDTTENILEPTSPVKNASTDNNMSDEEVDLDASSSEQSKSKESIVFTKHSIEIEQPEQDLDKNATTSFTSVSRIREVYITRRPVVQKWYDCGKCVIFFDSKLKLLRHISDKHMAMDLHAGPHCICDNCNSKFPNKKDLIQHLKETH